MSILAHRCVANDRGHPLCDNLDIIIMIIYLTLPYLTFSAGQVITPAQRWGHISSAQCTTPM